MPTLNWIGKDAVINHHLAVPFHLLQDVPELACGDPGSGNLIVEGDNLVALKALLPYYKGKVKCICIDPPYNTGNEGWAYNDNVNSPAIRQWLGQTVGKEGETLDRHDRWLCMMYPRLALLREFLSEDGAIVVNLDYREQPYLRLLLDEIFGTTNLVSEIACVNKPSGRSDDKYIATAHESITIYRKSPKLTLSGFSPDENIIKRYSRTDNKGLKYREEDLRKRGDHDERNDRPNLFYPFFYSEESDLLLVGENADDTPKGFMRIEPMKAVDSEGTWRWGRETSKKQIQYLHPRYMPNKEQWSVFEWQYLDERGDVKPTSVWDFKDVNSERGTEMFTKILGFPKSAFPNPKPLGTLERIIRIATNPGDLVLDSFAGSGTTGHAVLKMNAAAPEAEARRFLLVEMEPKIAQDITRERVRRVAEGYTNAKGDAVPGLGNASGAATGFRYVTLGEALFDETGQIRSGVRFAELARHVYFTETGEPLPKERVSAKTPLLGIHRGKAIFLLYNGILKDKSISGGNALCRETLRVIEEIKASHADMEQSVVYGTSQRLSPARLKRGRITFKQIPYQLRIS